MLSLRTTLYSRQATHLKKTNKRMASKYENTFGARIKNAEDVLTIVSTFTDFKPLNPQDNLVEVGKLISSTKDATQAEVTTSNQYSVSTSTRAKLVSTNNDSLKKSVSPIRSYLLAMYGKTDKQYININSILHQITGDKTLKEKKSPETKSISTSQQSYASLTQVFADLITSIGNLTPAYEPTNQNISLQTLREKHEQISQINNDITTNFNALTNARQERDRLYEDLKTRIQRIKKTVQSQYGNTSSEYEKIKGYRI